MSIEFEKYWVVNWLMGWFLVCFGMMLIELLILLSGDMLFSKVFGFLNIFICLVILIGI